ncbi:MAG TPA: fused MFS/spermidine synthase [Chloroflexota bacterium]|nr:fused MFS/spermidine synthase [Chloroflexota bacterium]
MGGLWVSLLIVFMASCCTMVLELVAGRILAPFIGVSLYTWTSIIGVCLAGISAGNFLGGVLADKAGSRRTLGLILLGGGLFSLIILPLAALDLTGLIPREGPFGARDVWLITRIVVVTALLFLPPTLILGMVSPIVIKLALTDLRQTGSIAGKIYAFSTVGSIVGTFLTGFYLVSAFGTRAIVLGVAVILIAMAIIFGDLISAARDYFGAAGRDSSSERQDDLKAASQIVIAPVGLALMLLVAVFLGYSRLGEGMLPRILFGLGVGALLAVFIYSVLQAKQAEASLDAARRQRIWGPAGALTGAVMVAGIIASVYWMNPNQWFTTTRADALESPCYKETNYFCIKVIDPEPTDSHQVASLVLDHLIHSYNSLNDPTYLKYGYIKVYADMIEYVAQKYPQYSAFFIGGGGYTLPRQMETLRPDAKIVVSEIDPGVTETNFERLGVDRNTRIITFNADAREVVASYQGKEKFDLVFGDAFNDLQIPYHLTTKEFAQKVRDILKDDGLYLALVIDKLRGGQFIPSYTRTVQEVFPYVYILNDAPSWNSPFPNTYLVAASATPIDMERIKAIKNGQGPNGGPLVNVMPKETMDEWLRTAPSVVLTDDYAPADNLVAPLFVERSF